MFLGAVIGFWFLVAGYMLQSQYIAEQSWDSIPIAIGTTQQELHSSKAAGNTYVNYN